MKRIGFLGLAILMFVVLASPVFAWELKMKGESEWRYRYWTRAGNTDIFGDTGGAAINLGLNHLRTYPTAGGANIRGGNAPGSAAAATFGVLAGENCYGADMTLTDYRMSIFPEIKVNPAISISAGLNLTSLGTWSDGQPYDGSGGSNRGWVNSLYVPIGDPQVATNVPNTYVTVQWIKIGMTTPMLNFSFGYKGTKFGIGLWKHECQSPSTSFGITAVYGPFLIEFAPYFSRNLSDWRLATQRNEGPASQERQTDRRNYFNAFEGGFVYNNGPLRIAFFSDSYLEPSAPRVNGRLGALTSGAIPSQDTIRYRLGLAAWYNNGRFFFNGEIDSFNRWRSGRATGDPVTGRENVGVDQNAWLYGTEFGALCGPAKVTLTYVRATGDDPSTRKTNEDTMDAETIATGCFLRGWGYLMYYLYGTGDGFNAAGEGTPTNFHHVGGRLDYAVASNLNLFGVYSYAWRDQPNAYRLGGDYRNGLQRWDNNDQLAAAAGGVNRPVPDSARDIGWEVDLGVNWKLLENLTWNTTLAFWKPGSWWSFAYPNTANIYANINGAAIATAYRDLSLGGLGRNIDALFAVETTLQINF